MLFVGVDWAEDHHDVCVMAEDGMVLAKRRVPDSVAGIGELHGLVAEHAVDDEPVVVGIEIDRGLVVWALLEAGYEVYAINPMAAARYRDRHATSGAKSDPGDAKVLADLVRTDRHNHRPTAGDSDLADGVKLLARAHQSAIWGRQRQLNALRSSLREYYPGPWWPSATTWPATTRWRYSRSLPPPSSAGDCRVRKSPRHCARAGASATSSAEQRRSKRPSAQRSSRPPN